MYLNILYARWRLFCPAGRWFKIYKIGDISVYWDMNHIVRGPSIFYNVEIYYIFQETNPVNDHRIMTGSVSYLIFE